MTRMQKEANERCESFTMGNISQLYNWIGNSANRLLCCVNYFAEREGTPGMRNFIDRVRCYKGI